LALTERGRRSGADALQNCGYVGPAPVPLETYERVVRAQTVPRRSLTREATRSSFSSIIIADELCDRLGVAMRPAAPSFFTGRPAPARPISLPG